MNFYLYFNYRERKKYLILDGHPSHIIAKQLWKNIHFWRNYQFSPKMGVALPRPSGKPKKFSFILKIFPGSNTTRYRSNFEKISTFNQIFNFFTKMGVALPRPYGWPNCYYRFLTVSYSIKKKLYLYFIVFVGTRINVSLPMINVTQWEDLPNILIS